MPDGPPLEQGRGDALWGALTALQRDVGLLTGRVAASETRQDAMEDDVATLDAHLKKQDIVIETQFARVNARLDTIDALPPRFDELTSRMTSIHEKQDVFNKAALATLGSINARVIPVIIATAVGVLLTQQNLSTSYKVVAGLILAACVLWFFAGSLFGVVHPVPGDDAHTHADGGTTVTTTTRTTIDKEHQ